MSKNKSLNTAIKATFPDGSTKTFSSIEVASKKLKLSEVAIKIRANKVGATGKDGIICEWLDSHTRRSYQAKKSRTKGANLELQICKRLAEIGFPNCVTARGESKNKDNDKIDIIDKDGNLPTNIQAKHTKVLPNYFKIKEACSDKSLPFTIIWKKSSEGQQASPGTVAIIDVEFFYKLLEIYNKDAKDRS